MINIHKIGNKSLNIWSVDQGSKLEIGNIFILKVHKCSRSKYK